MFFHLVYNETLMAKEDPDALLVGHIGQKVVLMKGDKVLMCKGRDFDKLWDLPGGRLHKNEAAKDGLIREVKEEIGVDIEVGKPLYACASTMNITGIARYYVVFEGEILDPNAELTIADDEIKEIRWVGKEEIDSLETWDDWRALLTAYFSNVTS